MDGTIEQGILGNSKLLVGIGTKGHITHLFWPNLDFAEHVEASFAGIYTDKAGFGWTTDPPWSYSQTYIKDAPIIRTIMHNHDIGVDVEVTDFVHPKDDILVRHFRIINRGKDDINLKLFYYLDMKIMETLTGNAAFYDSDSDSIIQYYRECYFACGGDIKMNGYQCGAHSDGGDAFTDVYDGKLEGNPLIISHGSKGINTSQFWDLGLFSPGEEKDVTIFLGMGPDEDNAISSLLTARQNCYKGLYEDTKKYWKDWLDKGRKVKNFPEVYRRSLITLKLLSSKEWGGVIAAPTTVPNYRFCWPRDGTYIITALDRAGYHEEAEKFYFWCKIAQEKRHHVHCGLKGDVLVCSTANGKAGGWKQRYFISPPMVGPSWGPQIDETGAVLSGMGYHYRITEDKNFLKDNWQMIMKAAEYICYMQDDDGRDGLMCRCFGPWEEKWARHLYSNAACYSGLKAASMIAKVLGEKDTWMARWDNAANRIKKGIEREFWDADEGHFIKSIDPIDKTVDTSILGIVIPFSVFSAEDERVKKTVARIEEAFNYPIGGIGRYPGDVYYGGNPWVITTMWLAIYYNYLGNTAKADELTKWCIEHTTDLDMLPEQVHRDTGETMSAIPLGWSHAMMVHYILELEKRR